MIREICPHQQLWYAQLVNNPHRLDAAVQQCRRTASATTPALRVCRSIRRDTTRAATAPEEPRFPAAPSIRVNHVADALALLPRRN